MNLNLFLRCHLKSSSLRLLNSWLFISNNDYFSTRQKLHLLLKLLGVEDFLIYLHLICGVRPLFSQTTSIGLSGF